jgi:hypothetical protein
VVPELIRKENGEKKQDCERNAGKRWLRKHGKGVRMAFPYAFRGWNQPFCEAVLKEKLHFIFACKLASVAVWDS